MPTLQLSMPTLRTVNAKTVLSLFLALPRLRYPSRLRIQEGLSNLDLARSILLTEWYDQAADDDLFLFVDSDQTFTSEDVHALIDLGGDVAVGACLSRQGIPNVRPKDQAAFVAGSNPELISGGTGVMLIRRPLLTKATAFLAKENGLERIWASERNPRVIPFFKQRFHPDGAGGQKWQGEDFAFCWLVRQVGGRIVGLLSPTIGHELSEVKYIRM